MLWFKVLESLRDYLCAADIADQVYIGGYKPSDVRPDENGKGLYEPSHGSAPDIAGQNKANPLATILSLAMLLRYSLNDEARAAQVENAVQKVLEQGLRTGDIYEQGTQLVSCSGMGDAVLAAL